MVGTNWSSTELLPVGLREKTHGETACRLVILPVSERVAVVVVEDDLLPTNSLYFGIFTWEQSLEMALFGPR